MIPRFLATLLILSSTLLASPISIGGLTYVSADPGEVTGGFLVTDQSGAPMPYRCDSSTGFANCSAAQPQTVQWMIDTSDKSSGVVRIVTRGRNG